MTVPQIGGMYRGDRARKTTLVEHGFRLPSALDNRPLNFQEFEHYVGRTLFVSATPGEYESKKSESGVLDHFTEFEPQEYLDYETELKKINAIQSTLDELQPQIEDLNWITRQELKDKNWRIFK